MVSSIPSLKNLFPPVNIGQVIVKDTGGFTYSSRFNKEDIKQQQNKEKSYRIVILNYVSYTVHLYNNLRFRLMWKT